MGKDTAGVNSSMLFRKTVRRDQIFFVLVCSSCSECNKQAVGLFDHDPTATEVAEVSNKIGGMRCIDDKVYQLIVGESTGGELYKE